MKETFVIDKIVTTESSTSPGLQVVLVPTKEVYSKNIKLVFYGPNCMQVLENFGMPDRVGDSISVEVKPKQTQGKLEEK